MKIVLFACLAVVAMAQLDQQTFQQTQQQFRPLHTGQQVHQAQEVHPIQQFQASQKIQAPQQVRPISGIQPASRPTFQNPQQQNQGFKQNSQSVFQNPQPNQGIQQNAPTHFQTSRQNAGFRPTSQPQFRAVQPIQPLSNIQTNSQFQANQENQPISHFQPASQAAQEFLPLPPRQSSSSQPIQSSQVKRSNPPVTIVTKTVENNSKGDFHSYVALNDGTVHENIGTQDKEGGTVMKGKYFYISKEGIPIKMSYTADRNGAVFIGDHIPTPPSPTQG